MHVTSSRPLLAPTVATGLLMAGYLIVRPYGDTGSDAEAARAFASTSWLVAHICGALALASFAWLTVRLRDLVDSAPARIARWSALLGAALVLPYYGAESFGLHAVGERVVEGDTAAFALVDQIRNQPAALTMFGLGLLLLAVAGVATAVTTSRSRLTAPAWAAWPLGVGVALLLPQFYLPPVGRIAYGVLYLAAALVLFAALVRASADGGVGRGAGATEEELSTAGRG
jgi:hypothetical protein